MEQNFLEYQQSITKEFDVVRDRVRNLIADKNWGEDGRYKEAILKNICRRFLPNNMSIGTGFILGENNYVSKQIDIIVYNNNIPVLFQEGDFVITTLSSVIGIIEVKTKLNTSTLGDVIAEFEKSLSPLKNHQNFNNIFTGLFSYEFEGNIDSDAFENKLTSSGHLLNYFALGTNYFVKFVEKDKETITNTAEMPFDSYRIYFMENLAFSYFISHIIYQNIENMTNYGLSNSRRNIVFPAMELDTYQKRIIKLERK